SLYDVFPHPDGVNRRIPADWNWPNLLMQHQYAYWHCGNPALKISPMKLLDKRDLTAAKLKKRGVRTYGELKRLMGAIDQAAKDKGYRTKKVMTQVEANQCFVFGQDGLKVPLITPTGRPRVVAELTWQSVLRLTPKK
ncbi:hypothetical protein ACHAXR_000036, partial [Thalassiosira sp. AJA248-18]